MLGPVVAQGHKVCLNTQLVAGSIPTRGNFHFFALVSRQNAAWSSLNTQCLQNPAKGGERRVSTLSSLCLLCYVQDTA